MAANPPVCRGCSNDQQCMDKNEEAPFCNRDSGECIDMMPPDCVDSDGCKDTPSTPICDTRVGMCKRCDEVDDQDACTMVDSGNVPYCAVMGDNAGSCVQCLDEMQCNSGNPVCDQATNTCASCTEHDHCADYSGVCDGGACAADSAVIYVRQADGLNANDCSKAMPCKTLNRAIAALTADRKFVRILDGANYTENLTINGLTATIIGSPATRITGGTDDQPAISVGAGSSLTLDTLAVQSSGLGTGAHGIQCLASTSSVRLVDVIVRDNPGVGVEVSSCLLTVERSVIRDNEAGGIAITAAGFDITNSFIVGNGSSASDVGGILITNGTSKTPQTLAFNTVLDNDANTSMGSGVNCTVPAADTTNGKLISTSSIIRSGTAGEPAIVGNCGWIHSNVEGIALEPLPTTNIDVACTLAYDANGVPRIDMDSMCKERGEPGTGVAVDYDRQPRPDGSETDKPDIGADEYFPPSP
jgi:hypothetical protein